MGVYGRGLKPLPIEVAHYNRWAWRLEIEFAAMFPRTRWRVPPLHKLLGIPRPAGIPSWFRIVATTCDGRAKVVASVTTALLMNEVVRTRLLVTLGQELERQLAEAKTEDE